MGRDDFDFEAVDTAELFGLRGGRAGHAAGEGIKSREVLERDGRQNAALAARRETFLGFEGGVETGGPAAVAHGAALVVVDGDNAGGGYEIIDVAAEQVFGVEGVLERVKEFGVGVEIGAVQEGLGDVDAVVGEVENVPVGFDVEVDAALQCAGGPGGVCQMGREVVGLGGDDEGDAGFIDEDGVGFVDHDGVEGALHGVAGVERDAVAEVIVAVFVGREVGDIGVVGEAALFARRMLGDGSDGESEGGERGGHPLLITGGQVVIGGPDVDAAALAGQGRNRGYGGDGFAFAGGHLDDFAGQQGFGGADLRGIERKAERARNGLARRGEDFAGHGFLMGLQGAGRKTR